jgi:hypothetical protein
MDASARKLARLVFVATLTSGLAACDIAVEGDGGFHFDIGAKAQDQWTRSYDVAAGGRLEILNVNGKILAEPASGSKVEIQADRTAKATSEEAARDLLGKIEMREEVSDGRVRIEVRTPRISGPSSHEIKWIVKVPKGLAVDLRTVNGGVQLTGLAGEIRARATNGGIVGADLAPSSIDAAVTNGGVDIILADAPSSGAIELESVNGGVSLALPPASQADIAARCTNGGISVDGLDLQIQGEQTRRRLDAKLNGGGARVSLETVNGGVKIRGARPASGS